jgi:predicted O-methyltransferase YrrM
MLGSMTQTVWTEVDHYFTDKLVPSDPALDATLAASRAAGLPAIQVTPNQGKLLYLLAILRGARRILEVGTLGGYSTIWLARALPTDGRLITLEIDPKYAEVARANIANAGLADHVEVRVGQALDTLSQLAKQRTEPFDFVFIDADKQNNAEYFRWALTLSTAGSVIIVDNVVRRGAVVDGDANDPEVQGTRRLIDALAAEPRVSATAIQTVGSKSYDGFALALIATSYQGERM